MNRTVEPLGSADAVLIYGGGGYGAWVERTVTQQGLKVLGVIDRAAASDPDNGAMTVADAAANHAGATVVMGVFSPQPDVNEISDQLGRAGFQRLVTPPQFFRWLGAQGVTESRYWLTTDVDLYERDRAAIDRARSLLGDAKSKQDFDRQLEYRLGGDLSSCSTPLPLIEQHTGSDLAFLPDGAGAVVDCGAYIGDTFVNWESAHLVHRVLLALEPGDASFERMVQAAGVTSLNVIPLQVGIAEHSGYYSVEGEGPSARLVLDEAGRIRAVSLDELLCGTTTSLIKMDIEGAEAAALRGGLEVLRRDRPRLAISIYHKPWHLWSIINWLDEAVGGYRFDLRCYGFQGYDTVLYAVPF